MPEKDTYRRFEIHSRYSERPTHAGHTTCPEAVPWPEWTVPGTYLQYVTSANALSVALGALKSAVCRLLWGEIELGGNLYTGGLWWCWLTISSSVSVYSDQTTEDGRRAEGVPRQGRGKEILSCHSRIHYEKRRAEIGLAFSFFYRYLLCDFQSQM